MSLNRVASIETFADLHTGRRGSDASVRPRKLSFNPLPQDWDPPAVAKNDLGNLYRNDLQEPVSAFEVPQWKRIRESSQRESSLQQDLWH